MGLLKSVASAFRHLREVERDRPTLGLGIAFQAEDTIHAVASGAGLCLVLGVQYV